MRSDLFSVFKRSYRCLSNRKAIFIPWLLGLLPPKGIKEIGPLVSNSGVTPQHKNPLKRNTTNHLLFHKKTKQNNTFTKKNRSPKSKTFKEIKT